MRRRMDVGFRLWLAALLVVLAFSSCTYPKDIVIEPSEFLDKDRIALDVQLQLGPDLCEAEWDLEFEGSELLVPLGKDFCSNAENMARALFAEVRVDASPRPRRSANAVLSARMVGIGRNRPWSGTGKQTTTVFFEWKMQDARENIIWAETVKGEGTDRLIDVKDQMQKVFDDLFKNSYAAISTSGEIRDYAQSVRINDGGPL